MFSILCETLSYTNKTGIKESDSFDVITTSPVTERNTKHSKFIQNETINKHPDIFFNVLEYEFL